MLKNKYLIVLAFILLVTAISACAPNNRTGGKYTDKELLIEQANILIEYGENLMGIGEYTKALTELLKAEELAGDNSHLKNLIGSAYFGRNDYANALIKYNEALELNPRNTEVHYYIGLVNMSQGESEKAKKEFLICLDDLKFKKQFLPLTSLGLMSLRENDEEQGLRYLKKAIEAEPSYPEPYYYIGSYYLGKEKYHDALGYFSGAIKQNNVHVAAYMGMGRCYEGLGRPSEAASAYGFVATTVPHTPLGIEAQANARRVLGYE